MTVAPLRSIHHLDDAGTTEPAPTPSSPFPEQAAGEVAGVQIRSEIPLNQQRALLTLLAGDELATACLKGLRANGVEALTERDFQDLVEARLIIRRSGNALELTPRGALMARDIARTVARRLELHHISYGNIEGPGACFARCSCGWVNYQSKAIRNHLTKAIAAGGRHLHSIGEPVRTEEESAS